MAGIELEQLRAELLAIAHWDASYERNTNHLDVEESAYRARRERRCEILRRIRALDLPGEGSTSPVSALSTKL
jgi:hypothetical protein